MRKYKQVIVSNYEYYFPNNLFVGNLDRYPSFFAILNYSHAHQHLFECTIGIKLVGVWKLKNY